MPASAQGPSIKPMNDAQMAMFAKMFAPQLSVKKPSIDAQRKTFALPDSFKRGPEGMKCLAIAVQPQTPSTGDLALARALLSQPEEVLKSIYYARWRSAAAYGDELLTDALAPEFRARKSRDIAALKNKDHEQIAQFYDVAQLRALGECTQDYCTLNRFLQPQRRNKVDARIADNLFEARPSTDALLRLAFLNTGELFTETACLQQIADRGFRHVEVHIVSHGLLPIIGLAHKEDIGDEVVHGYASEYHRVKVAALVQVTDWMGKNFSAARLLAHSSNADLLATAKEGHGDFHLIAALDPGMEEHEIQEARRNLRAMKKSLGAADCSTVCMWPGPVKGHLEVISN